MKVFSIANEIHIYLLSAPKSEAYRCSLVIKGNFIFISITCNI